jgi:hypothetical protein
VAIQKGFYQRQGIDLRLLSGGPDSPPADMLLNRNTDFTTFFFDQHGLNFPEDGIYCLSETSSGYASNYLCDLNPKKSES